MKTIQLFLLVFTRPVGSTRCLKAKQKKIQHFSFLDITNFTTILLKLGTFVMQS